MRTWVTDMDHLAPPGADVPAPARQRSDFTRAVAQAATSRAAGAQWRSAVKCIGRRGSKRCRGFIDVARGDVAVEWSCACCGESGTVTHVAGSDADLSRYVPRGKTVLWGFDEEEREVLLVATTHIPELRAVVARSQPHVEIAGLLIVHATVAELDEMYTLVEELTDGTRSRRRRDLLDGLRGSLCTSIDGF